MGGSEIESAALWFGPVVEFCEHEILSSMKGNDLVT
jgi:hypothetical protein